MAFDPSANLSPTERYVRLCTGLDAFDAAPIRGHAVGGGALGVIADVRIARTEGGSPSDEERIEARLRAQQVQNQQQQQQQQQQ